MIIFFCFFENLKGKREGDKMEKWVEKRKKGLINLL
jgi:hypothetical protein